MLAVCLITQLQLQLTSEKWNKKLLKKVLTIINPVYLSKDWQSVSLFLLKTSHTTSLTASAWSHVQGRGSSHQSCNERFFDDILGGCCTESIISREPLSIVNYTHGSRDRMWSPINWWEIKTSDWYSSLILKFYWLDFGCFCKGTSMTTLDPDPESSIEWPVVYPEGSYKITDPVSAAPPPFITDTF